MTPMAAGTTLVHWNGLDDRSVPVTGFGNSIHLVVNRDTYTNVGAIGNDVAPTDPADHTPSSLIGITVDPSGNVYSANGWEEAGADFEKWNSAGTPLYNANFQIRNGTPYGIAYSVAADARYSYYAVHGWDGSQLIERLHAADGSPAPFPAGAGITNGKVQVSLAPLVGDFSAVGSTPLRSMAVAAGTLWVTDAVNNLVYRYDVNTGALLGKSSVVDPEAIAVDGSGRVWVGFQQHDVGILDASGNPLALALSNVGQVKGLAFGPDGRLYVADGLSEQVGEYTVAGNTATLATTFGQAAQPGDGNPSHFFNLVGIAVDPSGNLLTLDRDPAPGGSDLAKWSPGGTLLWRHFGKEFASNGAIDPANPTLFISASLHTYRLTNPSSGSWQYLGDASPNGTVTPGN